MISRLLKSAKKRSAPVVSYEAIAGEYYDPTKHPTCRNFRDASRLLIQEFLKSYGHDAQWVCEIGCGDSIVAELRVQQSSDLSDVVLLDNSTAMIAYSARYQEIGAKLIVGDAEMLPFRSGAVDIIVSSLGDPYNTPAFWKEISRSLKPGGSCYYTTPSFEWAALYRDGALQEQDGLALFELDDGSAVYVPSLVYSEREQVNLVEATGLLVQSIRRVELSALCPPISVKISSVEDRSGSISPVSGYLVRRCNT